MSYTVQITCDANSGGDWALKKVTGSGIFAYTNRLEVDLPQNAET